MTHCTVVTSALNSFSMAGRATLSAVKSFAMTRTARPIAIRPAMAERLSESSRLCMQCCRRLPQVDTKRQGDYAKRQVARYGCSPTHAARGKSGFALATNELLNATVGFVIRHLHGRMFRKIC